MRVPDGPRLRGEYTCPGMSGSSHVTISNAMIAAPATVTHMPIGTARPGRPAACSPVLRCGIPIVRRRPGCISTTLSTGTRAVISASVGKSRQGRRNCRWPQDVGETRCGDYILQGPATHRSRGRCSSPSCQGTVPALVVQQSIGTSIHAGRAIGATAAYRSGRHWPDKRVTRSCASGIISGTFLSRVVVWRPPQAAESKWNFRRLRSFYPT